MELVKKYVLAINEKKSFSAAAKALFVSQPALSLAVSRLEKDLGFQIFDRTATPLSLTKAGRVYLDYLHGEEALELEMRQRVKALSELSYGSIAVGASCHTSYRLLPDVIAAFCADYPKISIRLDMGAGKDSAALYEKLESGELDVILKYDYDPNRHEATPVLSERMAIAMPRTMLTKPLLPYAVTAKEFLTHTYPIEKEFSDISLFRDVPFIMLGEQSRSLARLSADLDIQKSASCFVSGVKHTQMHYNLMEKGLGAVLLSDFHVFASDLMEKDIVFFIPALPSSYRTLYALNKHGAKENRAVEAFLGVALRISENYAGQKEALR